MRNRRSHVLAGALAIAPLVAQTTVTVPCAADNTLYQSSTGDLSNGAGIGVFVGLNSTGLVRRGLVRFDVAAAVPAGARILAVRLDLNVSNSPVVAPEPLAGHRLLQSWGEGASVAGGGGGNGGPAAAGDATWLHRFWNTTTWTTAGGDFVAAPSFVATMPGLGAFASQPSRQAALDVQGWLDTPATNHGWLLKGGETLLQSTHRLDSRESTGLRPTLVVSYLLPGQNGSWGQGCPLPGGNPTLGFVGAPIGGTTIQLSHVNFPNTLAVDFYALAIDPAGLPLAPASCAIHLPLAEVIPGPAFAIQGSLATPFAVPPGFPGYLVACQAALVGPGPLGFLVSNTALTVLQ